jgi:hypothetical protein
VARYIVGLDLGQVRDHSALAVLERSPASGPDGAPGRDYRGRPLGRYDIVHLERYALGTGYPEVVSRVAGLLRSRVFGIERPRLAIDATGAGLPVIELFLNERLAAAVHPVTITAGSEVRREGMAFSVPKLHLVSTVQALLQSGRLLCVPSLPLAEVLKQELLGFQVRLTPAGHEAYGTWREGAHDDLVLAVALAAWLGGNEPPSFVSASGGVGYTQLKVWP